MLKSLRIKTINDLRASRGQFLAVWLVVMLGVAFYGAMYPAGVTLVNSIDQTADELNYMGYQVNFDSTDTGVADRALTIDGVNGVEERLVIEAGLQVDPASPHRIALRIISTPDDRPPTVNSNEIIDGENITADNEILILKAFADHNSINPGDVLDVWINGEVHQMTVAGTVFNPEYMVAGRSVNSPFPSLSTFGIAWMQQTSLATAADLDGQVNQVVVSTASDDETLLTAVRGGLTTVYADQSNLTVFAAEQTPSGGVLTALVNGNFPIMEFFSGVFLLGSVVMTSILLGRLVQGERQRIGTMRAMGITRGELVGHYLSFGLLIGVTGGIAGMIFGYLNSLWVAYVFIELIIGGTLPAFSFAPQIGFLLIGFVVAVVGSVAAGVYPAWVESGTPPGVALRPAAPSTPSSISRIQLLFLPLVARRAIRNMLRAPGRAISTVIGVVLGAMMIFSAYSMWNSNEAGIGDFFAISAYDIRVDYEPLVPRTADSVIDTLSAVDGITGVSTTLAGPVSLTNAIGDRFDMLAFTVPTEGAFLEFNTLEGEPALSSDDGIWIGHIVQKIMGISAGDTVTIEVLGQAREVEVKGVVSQIVGTPVYVPEAMMAEIIPGGTILANSALVRVEPGQGRAVRDVLIGVDGVVGVEWLEEFDADLSAYLLFFRVGTLIFGGFGYLLTLAVLFNTVNAGMSERLGELSILRALGNSGREIALVVLLELLLLTIIGALIGIPIGRMMGFNLVAAYDTDVFMSLQRLTLLSLVLGFSSLLVIVFTATLPGLRSVQRIDLGAVSKSQSQ